MKQLLVCLVSWLLVAPPGWPAEAQDHEPEPFRYDAGGRRDPFMPLVRDGKLVTVEGTMMLEQQEPSAKPVLYGILWDAGGGSIALVNELEVRVGDLVGPYRVQEIRQDAVVLVNGGEPLVLELEFDLATTGGKPQ